MDMITVSAKTLDEAITKALIELQTTSEHLHYEVVQKESSGLFGFIGAKPCVIRARVMGEEEERAVKKAAAEKERREKAEKERTEREAKKAAEENKKRTEKASEAPAKKEPVKAEIEKKAPERNPEKKDADRKRPERREGSRRDRQEKRDAEKHIEIQEKPEKEEKPRQPVKADPVEVQNTAKEFLVQVFSAMGMEVSIETSLDLQEGELLVMMNGDDMGILIGKRGQTLDSLQYLVSLVVNKKTEGYLRVKLDTENYRERRKETLETLAKNISYKVKRTKHPVSLEPMNPYERRIIHSALQNDRYVVTRSEGEDPYRHVVISLKNDRYGNGRRDRSGGRRDRSYDKSMRKPAEKPVENTVAVNEGSEE